MNIYVIILIVSVLVASFSQILLKKGASKKYPNVIREYLNVYVISGYGLMFVSLFLTMISYRGFSFFAAVPVMESLGYVVVMFLGYFFFKEKITVKKLVGILLILCGIFICNML